MRLLLPLLLVCVALAVPQGQQTRPAESMCLLRPAYLFDGESAQLHERWAVLVQGDKIRAVGPAGEINRAESLTVIDLPGQTLMPGMIEAHSHILLHPYCVTCYKLVHDCSRSWNRRRALRKVRCNEERQNLPARR